MPNELTINLTQQFSCSTEKLFDALKRGELFKYTSAHMDDRFSMEFEEGGSYSLVWSDTDKGKGSFKQIVPNEKVSFTWEGPGPNGPIETVVTLTLTGSGDTSSINLIHVGFKHEEGRKECDAGWDDALKDLSKNLH